MEINFKYYTVPIRRAHSREQDAEEIEKYLTAIEFVVAVFREREELGDLEQKVFEDVKEIDQPREFDANRRFPNLERAHDEWDVE